MSGASAEGGFNRETLVWAGMDRRKHGCQPRSRILMVGGKLPETEPGGGLQEPWYLILRG